MDPAEKDFKQKVEQACLAGKEFSKLYYETIDKKRHLLSKLYQDGAEAGWNGNHLRGKDAIIKFYEDLPTPSSHQIESLDCQPISYSITNGQPCIIVKTYGLVSYPNIAPKTFNQCFLLISENNIWKIINDTFRFQDRSDV